MNLVGDTTDQLYLLRQAMQSAQITGDGSYETIDYRGGSTTPLLGEGQYGKMQPQDIVKNLLSPTIATLYDARTDLARRELTDLMPSCSYK